ncbi:MAG TPA: hypothetical protein VGA89_02465 [Patescibacteria group bacterium]
MTAASIEEQIPTSTQKSPPVNDQESSQGEDEKPPKKKIPLQENLARFEEKMMEVLTGPEARLAVSNIMLFTWELNRDFSHYSSEETPLGRGVPLRTEGLGG